MICFVIDQIPAESTPGRQRLSVGPRLFHFDADRRRQVAVLPTAGHDGARCHCCHFAAQVAHFRPGQQTEVSRREYLFAVLLLLGLNNDFTAVVNRIHGS